MKEEKKTKKQLQKEYKKLSEKAWKLWSEYRRKSACDNNGMVECFTCGKMVLWKRPKKGIKGDFANLGHVYHGKCDFSEILTQNQCTRCNLILHGNLGEYVLKLIDKYGLEKTVNEFNIARCHKGYTIEELQQIIEMCEEKLKGCFNVL